MVATMTAHARRCFQETPRTRFGALRRIWPLVAALLLLTVLVGCEGEYRSASASDPLYSGFGHLNDAEASWCGDRSRQPLCFRAYLIHAIHARSSTNSLFGDKAHNNAADAYRHCYWSARMTLDFGAAQAEGFGDRHEDVPHHRQPAAERNMDLTNNHHGRKAGQLVSTDEEASALCQDWSQDGTLQRSP